MRKFLNIITFTSAQQRYDRHSGDRPEYERRGRHHRSPYVVDDIESDCAERTISVNNTDKFGQAICAFANDLLENGNGQPEFDLSLGTAFKVIERKAHMEETEKVTTGYVPSRCSSSALPATVTPSPALQKSKKMRYEADEKSAASA